MGVKIFLWTLIEGGSYAKCIQSLHMADDCVASLFLSLSPYIAINGVSP